MDPAPLVELRQEGPPDLQPDALLLPELEAPPTGAGAGILLGKIHPSSPGSKDPEDPL
jgi:hypothetical protein